DNRYLHVAKVQLVSVMQALFGQRRVRFAAALPLAKTAEQELRNFKAKITTAGSETFLADWRTGQHDDIVLAVALAAWLGENTFVGPWEPPDDGPDDSPMGELSRMGVFFSDQAGGGGADDDPDWNSWQEYLRQQGARPL